MGRAPSVYLGLYVGSFYELRWDGWFDPQPSLPFPFLLFHLGDESKLSNDCDNHNHLCILHLVFCCQTPVRVESKSSQSRESS